MEGSRNWSRSPPALATDCKARTTTSDESLPSDAIPFNCVCDTPNSLATAPKIPGIDSAILLNSSPLNAPEPKDCAS